MALVPPFTVFLFSMVNTKYIDRLEKSDYEYLSMVRECKNENTQDKYVQIAKYIIEMTSTVNWPYLGEFISIHFPCSICNTYLFSHQ